MVGPVIIPNEIFGNLAVIGFDLSGPVVEWQRTGREVECAAKAGLVTLHALVPQYMIRHDFVALKRNIFILLRAAVQN